MPKQILLTRDKLGEAIYARLQAASHDLAHQWKSSAPINYFVADDLLPPEWTHQISNAFPESSRMTLKRSLRELKYVAAQMNQYDPLLEEAIYAFQIPEVVEVVHKITSLDALEPDEHLYAGGISSMAQGHFLNPHIDNSHDRHRQRYRVLNLLFYVSPDWTETHGCNLELWPDGPRSAPITITSRFNRLVTMVTHRRSWHSVSTNLSNKERRCVSNYYFSKLPVGTSDYFHVTSFRGRPEQRLRDWVLQADIRVRMALRRMFPNGIRENPHVYRKSPKRPKQ